MAADPEPAQQPETELEEVIVTGTLIRSSNQTASSPIVSAGMEDLERSGDVSLIANLNQMPQFNAQSGVFSGGQGTGGRVTINLRGLGSNRNLVLLDGRRLPMSDINGNVDTNAIPEAVRIHTRRHHGWRIGGLWLRCNVGCRQFPVRAFLRWSEGGHPVREFHPQRRGKDVGIPRARFVVCGRSWARSCCRSAIPTAKACMEPNEASSSSSRHRHFIGQGTFVPAATNLPNATAVNNLFASYGVATPVSNTLNLGFNDDGTLFTQTGARNYRGPTTDGYAVLAGNVRMPVGPQFLLVSPTDR